MIARASKAEPATRQDIIDYFGKLPEHTVRATVYKLDGEVVTIAGYWMVGDMAVMFADINMDAGISPFQLWREAKMFMSNFTRRGRCVAHPGSEDFLSRLGWTHVGPSDNGEVFEWVD